MTATEQETTASALPIVQFGDPVLRQVAAEIAPDEIGLAETQELIDTMVASLHEAKGAGLAAPQIGVSKRLILLDFPAMNRPGYGDIAETRQLMLINPQLVSSSEEQRRAPEGCLSIRAANGGVYEGVVERPDRVVVSGYDREGNEITVEADSFLSRAIQHEIDHLEGILYTDRITNLRDLRIVYPVSADDPVLEQNPFLR